MTVKALIAKWEAERLAASEAACETSGVPRLSHYARGVIDALALAIADLQRLGPCVELPFKDQPGLED